MDLPDNISFFKLKTGQIICLYINTAPRTLHAINAMSPRSKIKNYQSHRIDTTKESLPTQEEVMAAFNISTNDTLDSFKRKRVADKHYKGRLKHIFQKFEQQFKKAS